MAGSDAVDWEFARRVAARVARPEPFVGSTAYLDLDPSFRRLTAEATGLVAAETGLPPAPTPTQAVVTDRNGWSTVNLVNFRRLVTPVIERAERSAGGRLAPVGRRVAGAEVGALLGWMSTRVLGQYDLAPPSGSTADDATPSGDVVYYVGPNLLALERRYAFPAEEFRLWVALHECTHRAQFTGVPWLADHFWDLVGRVLDGVRADPADLLAALRRTAAERRAGRDPLARGGISAVLATPAQRDALDRLAGLMALLEGHGDVVMRRAGGDRLPNAWRFERVLKQRRTAGSPAVRAVLRIVGLEAKLRQYAQGEAFVTEVEAAGGRALFDHVWRGPAWLPTADEIDQPSSWIARVRMSEAAPG